MNDSFLIQMQILNMRKTLALDDEHSVITKLGNNIDYILFLEQLTFFEMFEMPFILLESNFINKIRNILNDIRYKTKDEIIISMINSQIITMNLLENLPVREKDAHVRKYIRQQEFLHKVKFFEQSVCATTLANDQIVLTALLNKTKTDISDAQLYASINYFLEVLPGVFSNDELRDDSIYRLADISKTSKNPFQKKLLKQTINQIHTIKDKN